MCFGSAKQSMWVRRNTPDPARNFLQFEVIRCVESGIDRNKPSPVKVDWPPETEKHSKLSPAIIRNLLLHCVAGGQQHSIEKQKTKGIFFYYTGELSRLVELFHFWLLCSPQSDFLWSMTLFLLHVSFGVTPKSHSASERTFTLSNLSLLSIFREPAWFNLLL